MANWWPLADIIVFKFSRCRSNVILLIVVFVVVVLVACEWRVASGEQQASRPRGRVKTQAVSKLRARDVRKLTFIVIGIVCLSTSNCLRPHRKQAGCRTRRTRSQLEGSRASPHKGRFWRMDKMVSHVILLDRLCLVTQLRRLDCLCSLAHIIIVIIDPG